MSPTPAADARACFVLDRLRHYAATAPQAPALRDAATAMTYADLDAATDACADHLRRLGVAGEQRVGVWLRRRAALIVALIGVFKAGAAYVPLDPRQGSGWRRDIIRHGGIRLVVTERALLDSERETAAWLAANGITVLCLDELPLSAGPCQPSLRLDPRQLAYVLFTSGTTGRPKAVMLEHRAVDNYVRWATAAYGFVSGELVPVHTSIGFDLTVTSIFPALAAGAELLLLDDEQSVESLVPLIERHRLGVVKITPAHLDWLREHVRERRVRPDIRVFVVGGEALHAGTVEFWAEAAPNARIVNEYGPTEAAVGCVVHWVERADLAGGSVPIGQAIAGVRLYVLGADLTPAAPTETGELYIAGVSLARGYQGQSGLTASRFVADPFAADGARMYRSGDLVRVREDGLIEYIGRVDRQVKVRGYRIELDAVENALRDAAGIQNVVADVTTDPLRGAELIAYVATGDAPAPEAQALRRALQGRLPDYMIPSRFVCMDSLPLTANGKVDRGALCAPPPVATVAEAQAASVEDLVRNLWLELLRRDDVGWDENFFDAGGHSFLLIQLHMRLQAALGRTIAIVALLEHPTVRSLAAFLEREQPIVHPLPA